MVQCPRCRFVCFGKRRKLWMLNFFKPWSFESWLRIKSWLRFEFWWHQWLLLQPLPPQCIRYPKLPLALLFITEWRHFPGSIGSFDQSQSWLYFRLQLVAKANRFPVRVSIRYLPDRFDVLAKYHPSSAFLKHAGHADFNVLANMLTSIFDHNHGAIVEVANSLI